MGVPVILFYRPPFRPDPNFMNDERVPFISSKSISSKLSDHGAIGICKHRSKEPQQLSHYPIIIPLPTSQDIYTAAGNHSLAPVGDDSYMYQDDQYAEYEHEH